MATKNDRPRRPYEFDHVSYDNDGDVLYLRRGERHATADTFGTPEGHAVRLDEDGEVIGITIVNAKWLLERDGKVNVTVPSSIEASADELARSTRGCLNPVRRSGGAVYVFA